MTLPSSSQGFEPVRQGGVSGLGGRGVLLWLANGTIVDPVGLAKKVATLADTGQDQHAFIALSFTVLCVSIICLLQSAPGLTKNKND